MLGMVRITVVAIGAVVLASSHALAWGGGGHGGGGGRARGRSVAAERGRAEAHRGLRGPDGRLGGFNRGIDGFDRGFAGFDRGFDDRIGGFGRFGLGRFGLGGFPGAFGGGGGYACAAAGMPGFGVGCYPGYGTTGITPPTVFYPPFNRNFAIPPMAYFTP